MSTTWNKLSDWKRKAFIMLTLVSAVNINAQNPYRNAPEAPMDEAFAMLKGNTRSSNTVVSEHPAYANRSNYRQTGQDQCVMINGQACIYDYTYSSGIMPYYEQPNNTEKLNSIYQCVDQYGRGIDRYMMVYELPSGNTKAYDTSGDNLRQQWQYGSGGFYAHPNFNQHGHYGPQHGGYHHRPSRAGEVIHGVGEVIHGIGRVINGARGGRR